ncbi:MAG: hypothetical protein ACFFF4_06720 [Candidatus Thorarchaeota archaeon]
MQSIMGNLLLAIYVLPLLTLMILIRKLAISSYRGNNYTTQSWSSNVGEKLANSKSLKFSIVFTTVLIATTVIVLNSSLSKWFSSYSELLQSSLIPAPLLLSFFFIGMLYVTMTHRGLAWWDANVIIFRYAGFHGRRSYLREEIKALIDENQDGVDDPYRAYLTLERLFNHEFDIGEAARDIIKQSAPEYYEEYESELLEPTNSFRFSYVFLILALVLGFTSVFLLAFGSSIYLPVYNIPLMIDSIVGFALSFLLMWIIFSTLEIPVMRPTNYLALVGNGEIVEDLQN